MKIFHMAIPVVILAVGWHFRLRLEVCIPLYFVGGFLLSRVVNTGRLV
jgi:hypothetical protein